MDLRTHVLELKTLGALDLRGRDGHVVQSVLAQPKRAALFIYLVIARPRGLHQRDTLLDLFWGERDEEHARKALRQALYYLRSSLGEDAIVTIGDGEVGVPQEYVRCDVAELEHALDENRLDDAVSAYTGELLPGFFVDDAPEFERWLETERARLHDRVAAAAWVRVRERRERGDLTAAAAAAERAAALAPHDEGGMRTYMQLLASTGQTASALRVYDALEERLRREYDAFPDPATREVRDTIRARSHPQRHAAGEQAVPSSHTVPAAETGSAVDSRAEPHTEDVPVIAGRPRRAQRVRVRSLVAGVLVMAVTAGSIWLVAAHEPRADAPVLDDTRIAVLPFSTSGVEATFAGLETGMLDLLYTSLNAADVVRAVDPRTVRFAWAQMRARVADDMPLDSALALARRLGAGRMLAGSVTGTPAGIVLNGTLYDARSGDIVGRPHAEGAHADLLALVDVFAAEILSTAAGEDATRIEDLTTRSLPALQAYFAARAAYHAGEYARARDEFDRALQIDTTFALAGLGVMITSDWAGAPPGMARRAHLRVWANRDALSERDRLRLLAFTGAHWPQPTPVPEQIAFVERALALVPDNALLWYQLGETYLHDAPITGITDWHERARAAFDRAVRLDSTFIEPLLHVVHLAAERRDSTALRTAVLAHRRRSASGHDIFAHAWLLAAITGDSTLLQRSPPLDEWNDRSLRGLLGFVHSMGIGLADGERAQRIRYERAASSAERVDALLNMQLLAAARGRPLEAYAAWQQRVREEPESWARSNMMRGPIYQRLYGYGSDTAAAAAAAAIAPRADGPLATDAGELRQQLADVCALELWRLSQRDTHSTASAIGRLRGQAVHMPPWAVREPQICSSLLEVLFAEARGERIGRRALQRLDSVLASQPITVEMGIGVPAQLRLGNLEAARLWEAAGDVDAALAALRRRHVNIDEVANPPMYLREECRLAIRTGRRELTRTACEKFFALMSEPEASLRQDVAELRALYARSLRGNR